MQKPQDDYIDLKRAIKEYGISRSTFFRYVKSGKLTEHKRAVNNRVWFSRREIEALLEIKPVK